LTSEHTLVAGIYASRFTAQAAYVDTHSCAAIRMESEQNSSILRNYLNLYVLCVPKTSSELVVRLPMRWDKPRSVGAEALAHMGWQQGHGTGL
jgi:hypothetical protein